MGRLPVPKRRASAYGGKGSEKGGIDDVGCKGRHVWRIVLWEEFDLCLARFVADLGARRLSHPFSKERAQRRALAVFVRKYP